MELLAWPDVNPDAFPRQAWPATRIARGLERRYKRRLDQEAAMEILLSLALLGAAAFLGAYAALRIAAFAIGSWERRAGRPGFRRPMRAAAVAALLQALLSWGLSAAMLAMLLRPNGPWGPLLLAAMGLPPLLAKALALSLSGLPLLAVGAWSLRRSAMLEGPRMPWGTAAFGSALLALPVWFGAGLAYSAAMGLWSMGAAGAAVFAAALAAGALGALPLCWALSKIIPVRAAPDPEAEAVRHWPEGSDR